MLIRIYSRFIPYSANWAVADGASAIAQIFTQELMDLFCHTSSSPRPLSCHRPCYVSKTCVRDFLAIKANWHHLLHALIPCLAACICSALVYLELPSLHPSKFEELCECDQEMHLLQHSYSVNKELRNWCVFSNLVVRGTSTSGKVWTSSAVTRRLNPFEVQTQSGAVYRLLGKYQPR